MVPNAPKWYETHQNMSLGSNGVDRVLSLRKIPMRLRGTNFCTSSAALEHPFGFAPHIFCLKLVFRVVSRHFIAAPDPF